MLPSVHEIVIFVAFVVKVWVLCCVAAVCDRSGSTSVRSVVTCWHSQHGRSIDSTGCEWCLAMVCGHRFGTSLKNGLALNELENSMVLLKAMLMLVS